MDTTPTPHAPDAQSQVSIPAMGLMLAGGIRSFFSLIGLLFQIIAMTGMTFLNTFASPSEHASGLMGTLSSGVFGIVISLFGVAVNLFVLYGGMQMKALKSYNLSLAAAIVAVIPCFAFGGGGCCCLGCFAGVFALLVGIASGIWAIVVLVKPEVKAAFTA